MSTMDGFDSIDRDAQRIAHVLTLAGTSAPRAATLSAAARLKVEAAAQVQGVSGASWRTAVEMLAGSARARATCPTCRAAGGGLRPVNHRGPCRPH